MTGEEFRRALDRLALNQAAFADYTGTSRRAVSNWTRQGPPRTAELLLKWMEKTHVPQAPVADEQDFETVREALSSAVAHVIGQAYRAGYRPELISPVLKSIADEYRDLTEQARGLTDFHDTYADTSGTLNVRGRGRPKGTSNSSK